MSIPVEPISVPRVPRKDDSGKLRYDLLDFTFVDDVVKVLTDGGIRYGDFNWRDLDEERVAAALLRHISAIRRGELVAQDTGSTHIAHAASNLMFLHHFHKEKARASAT